MRKSLSVKLCVLTVMPSELRFGEKEGNHMAKKAHPGFRKAQAKIAAKEGVSMDRAGAILASSSRRASPAAKKANPRLKRVKGK